VLDWLKVEDALELEGAGRYRMDRWSKSSRLREHGGKCIWTPPRNHPLC